MGLTVLKLGQIGHAGGRAQIQSTVADWALKVGTAPPWRQKGGKKGQRCREVCGLYDGI